MFNFSKKKLNKFRLLVETDRLHNVSRADRLYHRRNSDDRRDEFHNIMSCYYLKQERENIYQVLAVIISHLINYIIYVNL